MTKKRNSYLDHSDVNGLELKGWQSVDTVESSGAISWTKKGSEQIINATPQYNEDNEVPFEYHDPNTTNKGDEVVYFHSLRFSKYQSRGEQKFQYLQIIAMIIDQIEAGNVNEKEVDNAISTLNEANYRLLNKKLEEKEKGDNVRKLDENVEDVFLYHLQKFAEASDHLLNAVDQLGPDELDKISRKYPFKKNFDKVNKKIQKWFVRSWEL